MSTDDGKKNLVPGIISPQPAGTEVHSAPAVGASPVPVVAAEAETRGGAATALSGVDATSAPTETPETMFADPARFFLVIEDDPSLSRAIVRTISRNGASAGNVIAAKTLAEVTAAIESLKGKEGIKEVVVICDMKFPLDAAGSYGDESRSGIEAIKQLQAYETESGIGVSIVFNSSETSIRDEDRAFIDAAKAADTDGDKAGAVKAIRAMFEARVSPKES